MNELPSTEEHVITVLGRCNQHLVGLVAKMQTNPKIIAASGYITPYTFDFDNSTSIEGFAYFDLSNGDRISLQIDVSKTINSVWELVCSIDLATNLLPQHSLIRTEVEYSTLFDVFQNLLVSVKQLIQLFESKTLEEWLSFNL